VGVTDRRRNLAAAHRFQGVVGVQVAVEQLQGERARVTRGSFFRFSAKLDDRRTASPTPASSSREEGSPSRDAATTTTSPM
jgi:hypothetical protein